MTTISDRDIETIKAAANLREVVSEYVPTLKQQGRDWVGLCPFHDESTPSFKVDPKGFYKCHGCGKGGDVISFLREITGDKFPDVLKSLADRYSVPLTNGTGGGKPKPSEITQTYNYTDEQGSVLFQVCRLEPKSFRQRRPDGSGGWLWGLDKTRRVLYGLPTLADAKQVLLVEGEKDADALIAIGYVATCNPMGAGKWREEYTAALAGKQVIIFPDNDAPGRAHATDVAKSLLAAGCEVSVCEIPADVGGQRCKDVADWLAAGKTMRDLSGESPRKSAGEWLAATPPAPASKVTSGQSEIRYMPRLGGKTDSRAMSMAILQEHAVMVDNGGAIWHWNGMHWERIPERQLTSWSLVADDHDKPSRTRENEAVHLVLAATYAAKINWRNLGHNEVPCRNGVVNIDSSGVRQHRQEDYIETVIPHDYVATAQHPVWDRVLSDFFARDPDGMAKVDALQEFFGYVLLPHARYKKALFIHGESDTGKSLVADVLQDLVGVSNRCTISTEEMSDPRKREDIVGMLLNVMSELPVEAMIQDAGFKQLVSTGDAIAIDPKYLPRYTYVPICKHVFACNSLPIINDQTRATANRLLLIQFKRILEPQEQDRNLRAKLREELAGILAWAVEGAARLVQNHGEFSKIRGADQTISEYMADINPVKVFLEEYAVEDEDSEIPMSELAKKFREFEGGRPMTNTWIGRKLSQAGYVRRQSTGGKRMLVGYRWRA